MNIVDAFFFQAKLQPFAPALSAPGNKLECVSYARLASMASSVAFRASQNGIGPGTTVALFFRDPIKHTAAILGLAKVGAITASPSEFNLPPSFTPQVILSDDSRSKTTKRPILSFDETWLFSELTAETSSGGHVTSENQPCRLVLTSGSTGQPKVVALTIKHILTRISRFDMGLGPQFASSSRIFLDLGLSVGQGFLFLIYSLSRGGMLLFKGATGSQTLESCAKYKAQTLIASPRSLADIAIHTIRVI